MASGNGIGTQNLGVVEKHFKFDFPVTENIRVRGAASAILFEKVLEDIVPVVGGKIGPVQGDAELVANLLGIC